MPNEKKSKGIIIVKNGRNPKAQKTGKVDSISVEEPVTVDVDTEEKLNEDIGCADNSACGYDNQKEENMSQNIDNVYENSEQNDKSIENPVPADGFIDSENDNESDDISGQRSSKDTVVIANNVEYAPYLEFGSGTKQGGNHARYIMKRGIESKVGKMKEQVKSILEGNDVGISVGNIVGGK